MNCPKCGFFVNQGESFCRTCGSALQGQTENVASLHQSNPINVEVHPVIDLVPNDQPSSSDNDILNILVGQTESNTSSIQPVAQDKINLNQQQPVVEQTIVNAQPTNILSVTEQIIPNPIPVVNNQSQIYSQQLSTNNVPIETSLELAVSLRDELVDIYISKNADSLKKGGTSVSAFFFGIFYVLYRKMWFIAILMIVINYISYMFLPSYFGYIVIGMEFLIAFVFKRLYLRHVNKEVDKTMIENREKTSEQIKMICSKKGGTSVGNIFAIIGLIFVAAVGWNVFDYYFNYQMISTEVIGHKWISDNGSALYINSGDDYTFIWYEDDSNHSDNYYQGTYNIYNGGAALDYVRNQLSRYGLTESAEKLRIAEHDKEFDGKAVYNYYVILLQYGKSVIDGVSKFESNIDPLIGFYYKDDKYFEVIDMEEVTFKLTREDSPLFLKMKQLTYKIPAGYSEKSISNEEIEYSLIESGKNCIINLKNKEVGSYTSASEYLKKGFTLSQIAKTSDVDKREVYGKEWNYIQIEDLFRTWGITVNYAIIYNNKIYEVEFVFHYLPSEDSCVEDYNSVLYSLRLSE